jgi:hypothetical protein
LTSSKLITRSSPPYKRAELTSTFSRSWVDKSRRPARAFG